MLWELKFFFVFFVCFFFRDRLGMDIGEHNKYTTSTGSYTVSGTGT